VLALGALPIVYNDATGGGGIGEVDTQFLMAFMVDQATSQTVTNVPILCNDIGPVQTPSAPVEVGLSGGVVSALGVATNADGRLEVFALENRNQCSHWWQTAPGNVP